MKHDMNFSPGIRVAFSNLFKLLWDNKNCGVCIALHRKMNVKEEECTASMAKNNGLVWDSFGTKPACITPYSESVSVRSRFPIHFNIWVKNIWQGHLEEGNMENTEGSIA